jgi:hypothetical protein
VGAILVEGPNRWTHFWKRTIQLLFHQKNFLIEQMVSDKKIFWYKHNDELFNTYYWIFYELWTFVDFDWLCKLEKKGGWNLKKIFSDETTEPISTGHLGRRAEPPDTFLEENHPLTISSKFCSYWANCFRQEDFYGLCKLEKKGGWNLKKIFSDETTEPISTKLCWNDSWVHSGLQ